MPLRPLLKCTFPLGQLVSKPLAGQAGMVSVAFRRSLRLIFPSGAGGGDEDGETDGADGLGAAVGLNVVVPAGVGAGRCGPVRLTTASGPPISTAAATTPT